MEQNTMLKSILGISIAGIIFSGYLSYHELSSNSCPTGGCSALMGIPVCVYGLIMYLAVFILTTMEFKSRQKSNGQKIKKNR